jgi:SAM-dependent methyltransferase
MEPFLRNRANLHAYQKIASIYAGDEPTEDDPVLRSQTRSAFLERLSGRRILEIGCGPAGDSYAFSQAGYHVTATDFCHSFLEIARQRYPHLDIQWMDMTAPHFPDQHFDGIYGFASFLHLPREKALPALKALLRLLKPAGVLYLTLISSSKYREYCIEEWGGLSQNPVWFTCYSPEEFSQYLQNAGACDFEVLSFPSPLYEELPRLKERGVSSFHSVSRRASSPLSGLP